VSWIDGIRQTGSMIALFFMMIFVMPLVFLVMLFWFGGTSRNKCGDCGARNGYKSSQCWHCKAPLTPVYNR
jgi:predicted amidophosphoribosyltransferase